MTTKGMIAGHYWVLQDPKTEKLKTSNGGKAATPMLYKSQPLAQAAASSSFSSLSNKHINWAAKRVFLVDAAENA